MKKLATIILTLMVFFTSCKPEEENNGPINDNNTNKIKVSCTIPINDGKRSDFTNLFEDGIIRWSDGRECVYLAIPGDEPKIVELEGYCDGYKPEIEFIAYIDENTLTAGESYDIWYFGHSQQLENPYVSLVNGNKIEGSIAKQTGRLEDLGYSHIASTSVTAVLENGEVKLPLVGTLKNRMAIALVDLYTITELKGSAINTNYTLEFNSETGNYEFNVIEDTDATIEIEDASCGISYLVLLPNENNKVVMKGNKYAAHYCEYTFYNGIKENKIYHKLDENENMTSLTWVIGENLPYGYINGHEYVDLGLPSGTKWATCNIGANLPIDYGDYYLWGDINPIDYSGYGPSISLTNISGDVKYDAALANWGETWKMPTRTQIKELVDECTWTWTTIDGVNGYKIIGLNGASIFLPAAGYSYYYNNTEQIPYHVGEYGRYYSGTKVQVGNSTSGYSVVPATISFSYNSITISHETSSSDYAYSIRPVTN